MLAFASGLAALEPFGIVEAAIFVMLMELVFDAKMASGRRVAAKFENMLSFNERFSETAYHL